MIYQKLDLANDESTRGDPMKLGKECFEGIWFPESKRMMLQGKEWDKGSSHKEIEIGLENYDIFFRENKIVGNWASRGPDFGPILLDSAKFDQAIYMKRIPHSVALMSQEKIMQFLGVDTDYFRSILEESNALKETGHKNDLRVCIKVESITGIEQVSQSFGASLEVKFDWRPTMQDIYYHISGGNDPEWEPEWMPDMPSLVNKIEHREDIHLGAPRMVKLKGESKYRVQQTCKYNSTFLEALELEDFPFDVQEFQVKMKMQHDQDTTDLHFEKVVVDSEVQEVFKSSEWRPHVQLSSIQHVHHDEDSSFLHFSIVLKKQRAWKVYFWRVIFVMALISISSLFMVAIDPWEDIGDRLGYLVTMFLAALAYSIVISEYLPKLSYMTLLDIYVSSTYVFICALMAAEVLLKLYSKEENIKVADHIINFTFLGIWFFGHVVFATVVIHRYHWKEKTKLDIKEETKLSFSLTPSLRRVPVPQSMIAT